MSLTGLDRPVLNSFNPQNTFDAEGLTKLTMKPSKDRRKKRNDIERDADRTIRAEKIYRLEQARLNFS